MTELYFKGKEFVYNHHLAVPFRPLVPHPEKGIGPVALDGNLIIHGDNLHALKALLPHYAGKVDCIFIDPPYNTGNEGWCYNDNVNAPMIKEWLESNPIGIESPFENRVSGRVGVAGGCPWRRGSWPQRRRDAVRSLARAGASG
jgi:adenine-specific DNA-methyltransferase